MTPSDIKVGDYYFIHPFQTHKYAGAKVVIRQRFGVDFLACIVYNGKNVDLFYSDLYKVAR